MKEGRERERERESVGWHEKDIMPTSKCCTLVTHEWERELERERLRLKRILKTGIKR